MKQKITSFIDVFYPLFIRWMPIQTFRYLVCGSTNTLLGLLLYFIGYQYLFIRQVFDLGFFAFKPHVAALFLSSTMSFFIGFLLNKYVVFIGSTLKGRIQLFRYFLAFAFNLLVNYLMLKVLVEICLWDVMISQISTTTLVICISYLVQKNFSFKIKKEL